MFETKKTEVANIVGSRIRRIRQSKGFTIKKLALETGVEYTQLSRIERGQINTSVFQLFLISRALNINFSEIINGLDGIQFDLNG
jgi:transcriptional regulator with XRE-family HTH domain